MRHREDDMGQLGLTEQDYAWITQRIMDMARRYSKGRIVSCLEGGYVMGPLARSVEAHVRVLADYSSPLCRLRRLSPRGAPPEAWRQFLGGPGVSSARFSAQCNAQEKYT
jgi:hypothetical protein